jgi:hypothetical protein
VGWRVVTLKYGKKLEAASPVPMARRCGAGSTTVRTALFGLVFRAGGWREHLTAISASCGHPQAAGRA